LTDAHDAINNWPILPAGTASICCFVWPQDEHRVTKASQHPLSRLVPCEELDHQLPGAA
jgi:hypothetical protein